MVCEKLTETSMCNPQAGYSPLRVSLSQGFNSAALIDCMLQEPFTDKQKVNKNVLTRLCV